LIIALLTIWGASTAGVVCVFQHEIKRAQRGAVAARQRQGGTALGKSASKPDTQTTRYDALLRPEFGRAAQPIAPKSESNLAEVENLETAEAA
jgi:hypothetical protein